MDHDKCEEQILKALSKIKKLYAKKQRKLEKHIRTSKVRAHVKQKLKEHSEHVEANNNRTDISQENNIKSTAYCNGKLTKEYDCFKGDSFTNKNRKSRKCVKGSNSFKRELKSDFDSSVETGKHDNNVMVQLFEEKDDEFKRKVNVPSDHSQKHVPRVRIQSEHEILQQPATYMQSLTESGCDRSLLTDHNLTTGESRTFHSVMKVIGEHKHSESHLTEIIQSRTEIYTVKGSHSENKNRIIGDNHLKEEMCKEVQLQSDLIKNSHSEGEIIRGNHPRNEFLNEQGSKAHLPADVDSRTIFKINHSDDNSVKDITSSIESDKTSNQDNVSSKRTLSLRKNKNKHKWKERISNEDIREKNLHKEMNDKTRSDGSDSLFSDEIFTDSSSSQNSIHENKHDNKGDENTVGNSSTCTSISSRISENNSCDNHSVTASIESRKNCQLKSHHCDTPFSTDLNTSPSITYFGNSSEQKSQSGLHSSEQKSQYGVNFVAQKSQSGVNSGEQKSQSGVNSGEQKSQSGVNSGEQKSQSGVNSGEQKSQSGVNSGEQKSQPGVNSGERKSQSGVTSGEKKSQSGVNSGEQKSQSGVNSGEQNSQTGRRKSRRSISLQKKCSVQISSPASDCSATTAESSEEYETLKLIQESYCTGVGRSTRKRQVSNIPFVLSSVFQYFIDDACRHNNKEDFSLPIQQYGILMQERIPFSDDSPDIPNDYISDLKKTDVDDKRMSIDTTVINESNSSSEIKMESERMKGNRKSKDDGIHVASFQLRDEDILMFVDVSRFEQNSEITDVVICVCKNSLLLWKNQNDSHVCFKTMELPKGHEVVGYCQLECSSSSHLICILNLITSHGHSSIMVAIFDSGPSCRGCLLPVVSFKSKSACICCLKQSQFLVAGDCSLTKYSVDKSQPKITPVVVLEEATEGLTSLQLVNNLDSAVIGLTEKNSVNIWNHVTGSLLLVLSIMDTWSYSSVLTGALWEEGYLCASLFSTEITKSDSGGCLIVINPETELYKILTSYQCQQWNGCLHTFHFERIIGAIDSDYKLHVWDMFSGKKLLTESNVHCTRHTKEHSIVGRKKCVHIFKVP